MSLNVGLAKVRKQTKERELSCALEKIRNG